MFSSKEYWETRYKSGGNSGVGSYTKFAEFKASFVNLLIKKYNIESIIEIRSCLVSILKLKLRISIAEFPSKSHMV